jgi:hypothetical protein
MLVTQPAYQAADDICNDESVVPGICRYSWTAVMLNGDVLLDCGDAQPVCCLAFAGTLGLR